MRIIAITILSLGILALFQGCDYVKILHEEQEIIVVDQWLDDFAEISVEIPIELELVQTNNQIAVITGPEDKVSNLSLRIEQNVLIIDRKAFIFERKDKVLKIQLPIKQLRKIILNMPTELSSTGKLNLDNFSLVINGPGTYSESDLNLDCKSIYLGAFGKNSGDHILKGNTDKLILRLEGLAWANATQLIASEVTVIQRSLKSSYVHATEHLGIQMYSEGNVYYTGQPQLDFKIVQPDWNAEFGRAIQQNN